MRVCVIGAGAAGLAAARQLTDTKYQFGCVVFEQSDQIGGTWVYSDKTGLDDDGLLVHTSMYKNLRTNLPKEVMRYPDFEITGAEKSYVTQDIVLNFLNEYSEKFSLHEYIKFKNRVKLVEPSETGWKVTVQDLEKHEETLHHFDAVMVCNGHYHTPSYPQIAGQNSFKGIQIHSHDFRHSQDFKDKRVLVVGAGPSGMDIAVQISQAASQVLLSHHNEEVKHTKFPANVEQKPNITSFDDDSVVFHDGSREKIDAVVYCTGYLYTFPFLSDKCGIRVVDNHVQYLYKHLINVNFPTMCLIGIPFYVCAFSMFDLQARFFLEYLKGNFQLPSKQEMLEQVENEVSALFAGGLKRKHAHMMGPKQGAYYEELSAMARTAPLPPVLTTVHNVSSEKFMKDFLNFRNDNFRILDDHRFIVLHHL